MKPKMKRLLAVLLSVMMVFSLVPMAAWAETEEPTYTQLCVPSSDFYPGEPDWTGGSYTDEDGRHYLEDVEVGKSFTFYIVCPDEQLEGELVVRYGDEVLEPGEIDDEDWYYKKHYYTIPKVQEDLTLSVTGLKYRVNTSFGAVSVSQENSDDVYVGAGETTVYLMLYSHYALDDNSKITATSGTVKGWVKNGDGYDVTLTGVTGEVRLKISGYQEFPTYKVYLPQYDEKFSSWYTGLFQPDYDEKDQRYNKVAEGADFHFGIDFEDGYGKGENFAVKANGTVLKADVRNEYHVTGQADETIRITVERVVKKYYTKIYTPSNDFHSEDENWEGWISVDEDGHRYFDRVEVGKSFTFYLSCANEQIDGELVVKYGDTELKAEVVPDGDQWSYYYYTIPEVKENLTLSVTGLKYFVYNPNEGFVYSRMDDYYSKVYAVNGGAEFYLKLYAHYLPTGKAEDVTIAASSGEIEQTYDAKTGIYHCVLTGAEDNNIELTISGVQKASTVHQVVIEDQDDFIFSVPREFDGEWIDETHRSCLVPDGGNFMITISPYTLNRYDVKAFDAEEKEVSLVPVSVDEYNGVNYQVSDVTSDITIRLEKAEVVRVTIPDGSTGAWIFSSGNDDIKDEETGEYYYEVKKGSTFEFYCVLEPEQMIDGKFDVYYNGELLEMPEPNKHGYGYNQYVYQVEANENSVITLSGLKHDVYALLTTGGEVVRKTVNGGIYVATGGSVEFDVRLLRNYVPVGAATDVKITPSSGKLTYTYDAEADVYHCVLSDAGDADIELIISGVKEVENTHNVLWDVLQASYLLTVIDGPHLSTDKFDENDNFCGYECAVADGEYFEFNVCHRDKEYHAQYTVQTNGKKVHLIAQNDYMETYRIENITSDIEVRIVEVGEAHKHTFSAWEKDANEHWRSCSGCTIEERAEHTFSGNTCTKCGYTKPTSGGGIIIPPYIPPVDPKPEEPKPEEPKPEEPKPEEPKPEEPQEEFVINKGEVTSTTGKTEEGKTTVYEVPATQESVHITGPAAKEIAKSETDTVIKLNQTEGAAIKVTIPAGSELKTNFDLKVTAKTEETEGEKKAAVLNVAIGKKDALPAPMKFTAKVTETLDVKAGDKVYVYVRGEDGRLVEVANSKKTVSKAGNVTIPATNNGEYVILTEKAKDAVKLVDTVSSKLAAKTVEIGKKVKFAPVLPNNIAKVDSFTKGYDPVGQEEAIVTYKSSDTSIATVSKYGNITGKKAGKVKITMTVKLENGQTKTFTQTVTIK